jgi:hypothetical protein
MSQTAICLETGQVLDLESLLETQAEDSLHARFSGKRFGCAQCLMALDRRRTGLDRSLKEIIDEIDLGTLPKEKYFRASSTYEKHDEPVFSPSCFCHLPGLGASKRCESTESRHHAFCYELARGRRSLLFPGGDPQNLVVTTMARYIKEPSHREPDISFLVAESRSIALDLQRQIDQGGHRVLDFDGYSGLLAAEVQLSKLTVAEYRARTADHRKRFKDVAWIFHEHFLSNIKAVRAHMHEMGDVAWVIREEGGGRFSLEELPYKTRQREKQPARRPDFCKSALLILAEMQTESLEAAKALADQWERMMLDGQPIQPGFPVALGFPAARQP